MPGYCNVDGCQSSRVNNKELSFFQLPKEEHRHTPESPRKPPHANSSLSRQVLPEKVERSQQPPARPQTERQRTNSTPEPQVERQRTNSASGPPVERQRSNSTSGPQPQTARKRTSSGVFQVDDAEPPPKKIELVRSYSDSGKKKAETLPNGRRKESEDKTEQMTAQKDKMTAQKEKMAAQKEKMAAQKEKMTAQKEKKTAQKEKMTAQKEKVVERFDSDAKPKCVSAFKESDSWD